MQKAPVLPTWKSGNFFLLGLVNVATVVVKVEFLAGPVEYGFFAQRKNISRSTLHCVLHVCLYVSGFVYVLQIRPWYTCFLKVFWIETWGLEEEEERPLNCLSSLSNPFYFRHILSLRRLQTLVHREREKKKVLTLFSLLGFVYAMLVIKQCDIIAAWWQFGLMNIYSHTVV